MDRWLRDPSEEVSLDIVGSLALISVDCGADANYLNEQVLAGLARAVAQVTPNPAIQTVCLAGRPEAFLLGADITLFRGGLASGELDRIWTFTRGAHALMAQLAACPQRGVAWVRGPAIGGGLELALACNRIVASANAKFSLPETGLGIYPGMGGTQRLPRRIGVGLAKWMVYTGAIVPAEHALAIGLVDALAPEGATPPTVVEALATPAPAVDRSRFAVLEELFANHSVATLLEPGFAGPAESQAVRALIQLRSKAPVALRLAEQVIDRGTRSSLAEGLSEEFSHLREVFATEDARIGLSSLGQSRPRFVGR